MAEELRILDFGLWSDAMRVAYVEVEGLVVFLLSQYSALTDKYSDFYEIYVIPGASASDFSDETFFSRKHERIYIDTIAIESVETSTPPDQWIKSPELREKIQDYQSRQLIQILKCGIHSLIPRSLFVQVEGHIVFLLCEYSLDIDSYDDFYKIYEVPNATSDDFLTGAFYYKNFERLYFDTIPIEQITFHGRARSLTSSALQFKVAQLDKRE